MPRQGSAAARPAQTRSASAPRAARAAPMCSIEQLAPEARPRRLKPSDLNCGIGSAGDPQRALGLADGRPGHRHALELEAGLDPVARSGGRVQAASVVRARRDGVALDRGAVGQVVVARSARPSGRRGRGTAASASAPSVGTVSSSPEATRNWSSPSWARLTSTGSPSAPADGKALLHAGAAGGQSSSTKKQAQPRSKRVWARSRSRPSSRQMSIASSNIGRPAARSPW